MLRSNLISLLAVTFSVAALVITLGMYIRRGEPSLERVGCAYLEDIGLAHGAPVTNCVLDRLVSDDSGRADAKFGITQLGHRFEIDLTFVRGTWQVTAAQQS